MNDKKKLTLNKIESLLSETLSPSILEVVDESQYHIGHAGAASGGGHFRVKIKAKKLEGISRIQQHRIVNDTLKPLFANEIHALAIEVKK